jgi:hypothetical protein
MTMVEARASTGRCGGTFDPGELRALRQELVSLRSIARAYPLAYSLGTMELLFESRQDIELLVRTLAEEISEARNAA